MKKIIILFLSVFFIGLLFSCGDGSGSKTDTGPVTLYTMLGSSLYRINTDTANIVPVCPDPLCLHNDVSCPFYNCTDICPKGKMIYYLRNTKITWGEYCEMICSYDTANGKYRELYKPESGTIRDLFLCKDYLFFNVVETDSDWSNTYYLMRYTLKNGAVECLNEVGTSEYNYPTAANGERICFSTELGATYTTDLDYKDRIDGDMIYLDKASSETYVFDLELKDQRRAIDGGIDYIYEMTRTDTITGETVTVFDELGLVPPILYNGKIIYAKLDEARVLGYAKDEESGELRKVYDKYGGKFYICNLDGSGEELLCDISEDGYAIYFGSDSVIGGNGIGDSIVINVFKYKKVGEQDGKIIIERDDNAYLIINTVTGEVKVAEIEKRS